MDTYRGMLEERLGRLGELLESATDTGPGGPPEPADGRPRTITTDT